MILAISVYLKAFLLFTKNFVSNILVANQFVTNQIGFCSSQILFIHHCHGMYSSCRRDIGFDVAITARWDLKRSAERSTVARPMPCSLARRSAVSFGESFPSL